MQGTLAEAVVDSLREWYKVGYFRTVRGRRTLAFYARLIRRYAGRDEARYFLNQFRVN